MVNFEKVVVGAGLGLLHTLHCDESKIADLVPVDYVINACMVITYDVRKYVYFSARKSQGFA